MLRVIFEWRLVVIYFKMLGVKSKQSVVEILDYNPAGRLVSYLVTK